MPEPRKSAVERQREQREATWIEDATKRLVDSGTAVVEGDGGRNVVVTVLRTVVNVLSDRAELHEEIKRSGWKAGQAAALSAANHVQVLVGMVEAYVPPTAAPDVVPQVPLAPDGTPDTSEALRDRLAATFGPNLDSPTYSEIRRQTESEIDGSEVGYDKDPLMGDGNGDVNPPVCTMGPACPVHPLIQVLHPASAPTDIIVGPTGGTEVLPRDDAPADAIVVRINQPMAITPTGVIETGETSMTIRPAMPTMSDASAPPAARQRLTYAELYARRASRPPEDHRSVSQITAAADCGIKLALYREPEDRPAWWFVAGTVLHTAIEAYERGIIAGEGSWVTAREAWNPTFYAEIERVREATGVPTDRWRAARGGAEGYDWWRVEGEQMLARYMDWSHKRHAAGWSILTIGDAPVLEYPFRLDVQGIPVDGFIDQAWTEAVGYNGEQVGKVEIIDLKFGSSRPDDRFQLGVYAHAVVLALAAFTAGPGAGPVPTIGGAYYLGRKGELYGQADDLRAVVPWDDVVHRTLVTDAMDRSGLYLPRRSSFCNSCGVRDLCPAGAS